MDKSNLELFKQAVNEAVSNKFDSMADSCTEEIVCSEKHKLAIRTIIYGETKAKRVWSPKMKRIIAILVAAALLLTSCGILFGNEIREIIEDFFVKLTYSSDEAGIDVIEELYELTYLPEGYALVDKKLSSLSVKYNFTDKNDNVIKFEQRILNGSDFVIDNKSGYSQIKEIKICDIYYRYTDKYHCYIWNDEKYSLQINSSTYLSSEEIVFILKGIKTK